MTITSAVSDSELFRDLVKRRKLTHPTSAAFDMKAWVSGAAALAAPTSRDYELMLAAIYFGNSIAKLRPLLPAKLSEPFTRESGTRLLVGIANEQYLTLRRKSARLGKRLAREGGAGNLEQLAQSRISSPTGQSMTGDDHVTHLIDSLPHWLHQLVTLPADKKAPVVERPFEAARDALMLASVSRGLRDLWHAALWEGREVVERERFRVLRVADRELAERWLVWNIRWQSIMAWEAMTDAGALMVAGRDAPPVTPVQARTVVRIERSQGRKARIVVGRADGHARRQRSHVSERDMLDRLYTGIFMDEPLPKTGTLAITCRELMRVWWLLEDLGETIVGEIGTRAIGDGAMLRTASCTWPIDSIETAVAAALGIDLARASALLRFVTLDPTDTSSLFDKSLWWTPLVPGGNGRCHLLLAPLFAGNPVRLVEHWLEVGGISDQGNLKGRGRPFEAHVRLKVKEHAGANPLITDFDVLDHGLKRKGESEEIDLLVRIGDTVIVGEVKCFLSPVEPSDRYNYLVALEKAADQARRKLEWVDANRAATLAEVGITDPAAIKAAKLVPAVVLNQGNGIGLTIEGVPFVDFHYLSLVIGSRRYQADTGFTAGRTAGAMVDLYTSQADLQARLPALLKDPPPLRRFAGKIEWTAEPFPSPDGKALMMEIPRLAAAPMNEGAVDQLTAILSRRS